MTRGRGSLSPLEEIVKALLESHDKDNVDDLDFGEGLIKGMYQALITGYQVLESGA
jgi:hypothetical protein